MTGLLLCLEPPLSGGAFTFETLQSGASGETARKGDLSAKTEEQLYCIISGLLLSHVIGFLVCSLCMYTFVLAKCKLELSVQMCKYSQYSDKALLSIRMH